MEKRIVHSILQSMEHFKMGQVNVNSFNQDISLLIETARRKYENALIEIADTNELQVTADTA
ncbi:hypothetical protein FZC70_18535 [Bacillus subtilis]|nr:hypothetical protein [Bacillus subtilis]TYS07614.1 hypothetical protein FZC70_18535 [Bacillus subtilis]